MAYSNMAGILVARMTMLVLAVSTPLSAQGPIQTIVPAEALLKREYHVDYADGREDGWETAEVAPVTLAMDKAGGKIYWAYDASIHRANLDGSVRENFTGRIFEVWDGGAVNLGALNSGPFVREFHIGMDPTDRRIYLTALISHGDYYSSTIMGLGIEELSDEESKMKFGTLDKFMFENHLPMYVIGIAMDFHARQFYYMDYDVLRRGYMDFMVPHLTDDGVEPGVYMYPGEDHFRLYEDYEPFARLWPEGSDPADRESHYPRVFSGIEPVDYVFDSTGGYLYFSGRGPSNEEAIWRSRLREDGNRGGNRMALFIDAGSAGQLTVDEEYGKLYWAEGSRIRRTSIEGTRESKEKWSLDVGADVVDLLAAQGQVYWVDSDFNIRRYETGPPTQVEASSWGQVKDRIRNSRRD